LAHGTSSDDVDVFNAIGESSGGRSLVLLQAGEGPVTELAQDWG